MRAAPPPRRESRSCDTPRPRGRAPPASTARQSRSRSAAGRRPRAARRSRDGRRSTPPRPRRAARPAAPPRRTRAGRTSGAPARPSKCRPTRDRGRSPPPVPTRYSTRGCGDAAAICPALASVANALESRSQGHGRLTRAGRAVPGEVAMRGQRGEPVEERVGIAGTELGVLEATPEKWSEKASWIRLIAVVTFPAPLSTEVPVSSLLVCSESPSSTSSPRGSAHARAAGSTGQRG